MISLFLDTSTKYLVISLYKDKKEIYFYYEESNNDLSRKVLPKIDEILNKLVIDKKNIDNIYVVNGPGSFTGIRIGITIAKVWGWTLGKKVYPVSSLRVMATTSVETKYVVPLIDARRGYVYAGMYQDDKVIIEDQYILLEDLLKKININDVTFVSYDEFKFNNLIKPKLKINKVLDKLEEINPHKLNPNYLKKTEAEENLNDRNS